MNKFLVLIILTFWVRIGASQQQDLRSLVNSAYAFPPKDEGEVENALNILKEMPNAEARIWDFIENAEIDAAFHVESGLSALERAGLVSDYSLSRSREILGKNVGIGSSSPAAVIERDPDVSSFAFGTSLGGESEDFLREIGLVGGAIALLGRHGSIDDVELIEKYVDSRFPHVREEAVGAIEVLKASDGDGPQGIGRSNEVLPTASNDGGRNFVAKKECRASGNCSGRWQHLKQTLVFGGFALLGILLISIWVVVGRRSS